MRLGADPEVFLVNRKTKQFQSVIGLIGAGKDNPLQVEHLPKGFTLQEDNVALEFGIPPAASADEFVHHIQTVMRAGLSKCKGMTFSKLSCTLFPDEALEHPMARVFGCEPDYNAYTGDVNPRPEPPHPSMRSAGGHIHFETKCDPRAVVKALDCLISVPAVLMDDGQERRKIYGKAGAYRPKPYGGEYRTPSNFWIFDEKYIRWVWGQSQLAERWAKSMPHFFTDGIMDRVQECINTGNREMAESLCDTFKWKTA